MTQKAICRLVIAAGVAWVVLALNGLAQRAGTAAEPIDIGSQSQLFVDDYFIDSAEGIELAVKGPVLAPIRHEKYYRGERESFGYRPRFQPNVVTFDPENRPYVRTWGPDPSIQTLDDEGRWIKLDFKAAIRQKYPDWDGKIATDFGYDQRVVFDHDGDAYLIAAMNLSSIGKALLLHSRDRGKTWAVYDVPWYRPEVFARLESQDGHNDLRQPPAILAGYGAAYLIAPVKRPDGTLELPDDIHDAICIATGAFLGSNHSGGANSLVTSGDLTHVVWGSNTPLPGQTGTPQYAATYDRRTGKVSERVLLGFGQTLGHEKPDDHNMPAISLDSQGYLHVLLGAHHEQFRYTRSLQPNSTTSGWTEPVPLGVPRQAGQGSYTYISLICDQQDTLHVVGRWAGAGCGLQPLLATSWEMCCHQLVYLRKKAGQPWEEQKSLVIPFRNRYSCWYHKLSLDRKGRLFLNYIYYSQQLTPDEVTAYREKWPNEEIRLLPDIEPGLAGGAAHYTVGAHDPAMLMSDDGGDTWRLALTVDLAAGRGWRNDPK